MRPLETSSAIFLFVSLLNGLFFHKRGVIWFSPLVLCLLVFLAQAWFEGTRWQLWPFYVAWLFLASTALAPPIGLVRWHAWVAGTGLLALAAGVLLCLVLPVFNFPQPTGPYGVGTKVRHLADAHRLEPHAAGKGFRRELVIQIWYPTAKGISGRRQPYRDSRTTSFWTSQLALVKTNSIVNAPILHDSNGGSYPVLLFSPSWSGEKVQNTIQMEELASHGYVVVAMDHPYGTDATVFPDGRIIRSTLKNGEDYSSQAAFEAFLQEANTETEIRAHDAQFVLDTLDLWNDSDPEGFFTNRLETTNVGIFGHSLGGSVAIQACWLDTRFRAAVDMDGMVAAESADEGAKKPVLFIMELDLPQASKSLTGLSDREVRLLQFNRSQERLMKASLAKYGGAWLEIPGTTHKSFSDSPLFSPLKFLSGAGTTDAHRTSTVINAYILAFFDKELKNKDSDLLEARSPKHVGLKFEVWPGPPVN